MICREAEICRWGGRGGKGGQLTVNSEIICREAEICRWGGRGREGGVDRQSTQRLSAERLKFVGGEGGQSTVHSGRIREDLERICKNC